MSENRAKYSSVPLQDMRKRPPNKTPSRSSAQVPNGPPAGPRSFVLLQVLLVAVLPLTFVVALLAKDVQLYWGFVIVSAICLGVMVLMKAFVLNARRVLSVIHAAMIAVSLFAILMTVPPPSDTSTQQTQDLASIFSDNTSASMVDMTQAQTQEQPLTSPNPGSASQAQQKLDQFMSAWSNKDYAAMVSYSSPDWVNKHQTQRDAETDIFHLSAIRTPLDYQIQDVSGNDSDQTRTITMQASISKNDGKEPQLYNFQILMIRVNSDWYVDPNSISSSQVIQQTAQQTISPDQAAAVMPITGSAVPAVRSDTILYYNQDGGEFYHFDPNCDSVGSKYKPLTAMFYYRDVSSETFKNLKPCPVCKAPARQ